MTATFGIFVKFPEPGRVKTRLAAEIGDELACRLYLAFLMDLVPRFQDISARRVLAYTPNDGRTQDYFQQLGKGKYELWPQPEGTLANRMAAFFETFGPGPAVLVGSDSPTLAKSDVEYALQRLTEVDVLLGPATDGGLYLIGLCGPQSSRLLRPIEWSTSRVFDQMLAEVRRNGLSVETMRLWYDIDTLDDVNFLRGHLAALFPNRADRDAEVFQTSLMLDVLAGKRPL